MAGGTNGELMLAVRSLAVAAIAIQAMLLGGVVGVRSSIYSRFMRIGMLVSSVATFAAAAVVLVSLLAAHSYEMPEYVMAALGCALSAAELAGVWLLVLYINNQQRSSLARAHPEGRRPDRPDGSETSHDFDTRLLDALPTPVWRTDASGRSDYFNEAWLDFRGRRADDERGDGWLEGVHPDDIERCVGARRAAFAKRAAFDTEYRLRNAAGEYRPIADHGRPFRDEDGAFAGHIGSCVEVCGPGSG